MTDASERLAVALHTWQAGPNDVPRCDGSDRVLAGELLAAIDERHRELHTQQVVAVEETPCDHCECNHAPINPSCCVRADTLHEEFIDLLDTVVEPVRLAAEPLDKCVTRSVRELTSERQRADRLESESASLRAQLDEAESSLREIHAMVARGDHGPVMNHACAVDAIAELQAEYASLRAQLDGMRAVVEAGKALLGSMGTKQVYQSASALSEAIDVVGEWLDRTPPEKQETIPEPSAVDRCSCGHNRAVHGSYYDYGSYYEYCSHGKCECRQFMPERSGDESKGNDCGTIERRDGPQGPDRSGQRRPDDDSDRAFCDPSIAGEAAEKPRTGAGDHEAPGGGVLGRGSAVQGMNLPEPGDGSSATHVRDSEDARVRNAQEEPRQNEPSPAPPAPRWRVGRSIGRTLYRDDRCVGVMDTAELAAEIVMAVNRQTAAMPNACPNCKALGTQQCAACWRAEPLVEPAWAPADYWERRANAAEADRDLARSDVRLASGEFLVPLPEPGTDMARVMLANAAMRRERDDAKRQLSGFQAQEGYLSALLEGEPEAKAPASLVSRVCQYVERLRSFRDAFRQQEQLAQERLATVEMLRRVLESVDRCVGFTGPLTHLHDDVKSVLAKANPDGT